MKEEAAKKAKANSSDTNEEVKELDEDGKEKEKSDK
jgi:hypothetical protein